MQESPIFARVHDLLLWLIPQTLQFPRAHRFGLAKRLQDKTFDLQERLLEAAMSRGNTQRQQLVNADILLAQLRYHLRLAQELGLLTVKQYAHVSSIVAEVGRMLGAWLKKAVPA